jgi:hypothetical protein
MRVRASKRKQLVMEQREAAKEKRSADSKVKKQKRKAKDKAEKIAKAVKRSAAAKEAAETLKEKRTIRRKKEQANYQKTRARASARMGGRRKQIEAELQAKLEQ